MPTSGKRYVGFDIGTRSVVAAAVDAEQTIVLQPRKISVDRFALWVQQNLTATDAVVVEATGSAWHYYDLLHPHVATVTIADAQTVKSLAQGRVKTDSRDAVALARLLAAGLVRAVWVPPPPVRDLRALLAHRRRLLEQRTRARNRLHGLLFAHQMLPPDGDPFHARMRPWWESLPFSLAEKLRLRQEFQVLTSLEPMLTEVDQEVVRLSTTAPWATQMAYLIQLPGVGVLTAMTVLAAIGDITRFPSAKKLVGYSGLGASVSATGQTYKTGGITKHGRRDLRTALVEATWVAIQDGYSKAEFARLNVRLGKAKAVVALARKLLVTIWHVLTKKEGDRRADPARVVRKVLNWGVHLKRAGRDALTLKAFACRELDRLGMDTTVANLTWQGKALTLVAAETG